MIHNLGRNDMRELLTLATYKLFFIFDQVLYRQIDLVAMGSPLDPTLMNAFLCHFKKQWLSECVPNIYTKSLKDILMKFL